MKKIWILAVLLGVCGWALGADKALDRDGNYYVVFPTVINNVPVLQMQIYFVTGAKTFMTVPGSDGPEVEANPQIYLSTNPRNVTWPLSAGERPPARSSWPRMWWDRDFWIRWSFQNPETGPIA